MNTNTVRTAGWLGLIGAIIGAAVALVVAFALPEASEEWYVGSPVAFILHPLILFSHAALIVAVIGVYGSGAAGSGMLARWGAAAAVLGLALLNGCEIWFMTTFGTPYPSPATEPLNAGYGISSIVIGVGMTLLGIAVLRSRVWTGARRFTVLACGLAIFVPVLPAVFIGFVELRLALTVWNLLWASIGIALIVDQPATLRSRDAALVP